MAVLAASVAPASAQFWPQFTDKEKKGRFRLGPAALTPRLELRNAGVDTNVYVTPNDPTRDTALVLRAGANLYVPAGRRIRAGGTGWLDFNYFASEDDQSSTDPGAQGRVEIDAWRLTFTAGGGGFRARQLYSIDIDERIRRSESFLNGGARLRLSSALSAEAGVEGRSFRWNPKPGQGDLVKTLLDRDSTTWKGGLRYRLTPLTDLLGSVEKIDDTFVYTAPGEAKTTSYRYLAGFEFGQKAILAGRFLAGVRDIPAGSAGSVQPYTGPTFEGSIVAPVLQRTRLGFDYDRDVYYGSEGGRVGGAVYRNTFTYDQLRATLDVDLALDLVVRLTGGLEKSHYLRPFSLPADGETESVERRDTMRVYGISLLRRIGESAMLGLSAIHTSRDSNYPGANYGRWQYGVQGFVTP